MNDEMKLANQLCFSIYNANRLFNKFYQQALEPFRLTYPQYLVLLSLWERDHQTLHELGEQLDLASNTLTPLLKRLEKAGWLTRQQIPTDKRQLVINLSRKGQDNQSAVYKAITHCVGQEHLDISQYRQVLAMNDQLIKALEKVTGHQ